MGLKPKLGKGLYRTVWRRRWVRAVCWIIIALFVFEIGVNVGDGRIALHRQTSVAGNLPSSLNYASVNAVYNSLKENYDGKLSESQLLDGLKHGLAQATNDPYTEFFTAAEAKDFNDQLNNSFSGIGAELGKDSDGNLQVIAPVSGTPAAKAGLAAKDIITSVNGQSTSGMSVDDAVSKIRGKAGTKVTLTIVRQQAQQLNFVITRQNIQVPSVTSKVLPDNIGYIQISTFADDTSQLMQQTAVKMKQAKVKGIVLDLRNNPGGLLNAAVDVSSEWLPADKLILQEKRGNTVEQSYAATGNDTLHAIPTVVLINGGSASASEITTGALHDDGAAYVIGEKSYGKGVVQQIINFGDGSELKVTVASWYRPNGQNINHKGITPDQSVKQPTSATTDNDPQLQAAETYLNR